MKKLYLIGGGGHCKSCIDVIETGNEFKIEGIFDILENMSKKVLGYPVIGTDADIGRFISSSNYFLITLGQIKTAAPRILIFENLELYGAQLATVISPRAHVSQHAKIGRGTIVMHDVLINADSAVGENCIINTKSLIEHDVVVGSHCHVSTASVVNGGCRIGTQSFIGSNSVLREGVMVAEGSIVSAGSFYRGK